MRMLGLVLIAAALAAPAPARSAEATGYLAPRDGAAVNAAGLGEAPSDTAQPIDLRRGVLGTEVTDGGEGRTGDGLRHRLDRTSPWVLFRGEDH
jgi:hypothetical protein